NSEDNPDVDAHQRSPAAGSYLPILRKQKKAPSVPGLSSSDHDKEIQGSRCPRRPDTIPRHKSGKARNQMQRAGLGLMVRPETSRVLTLSNSGPVFLGSRGFSFRQGADRESATTRLEGGVHSRRAGAVGHNTEREASCDQDNANTSADLEPVKVAIVVSQL